ncbi:MAG: hypothetical protein ABSB35_26455 [Bryobacteraceae bacterium]|jgi:hypothetical protein
MNNTATDRKRRREEMTADIEQQVRNAVQDELAGAPLSFDCDELERIEESVMSHTQHVLGALSFEEMQSEGALLSHIANARLDTTRRINERRPSSGSMKQ